ncbi:MAG: DUF4249 family protein [Bacteroidia bacterium]|nr:DUF4249 family protein [Bacteroidia bacterium]
MKNLIIFILPLLLFNLSCEQESLNNYETETAVVSGYIYAGYPVDSIRITQSISYSQSDSSIISLDELSPSLSDANNSWELLSIGNGYYHNPDIIVLSENSYQLKFEHKGNEVSAITYVPQARAANLSTLAIEMDRIESGGFPGNLGEQADPIEISWDNSEGDYYYVLIENIEDDPRYINEFLRERLEESGELRRFQRITEPEITDFYAINPMRELQQFGTHRVIVFRVNPEYAALYQSSSNSTLTISEPPSNVNNGLGIFSGLSSDTLYFEVNER